MEGPDEPEFVGVVQNLDDQPQELLDNDPRVKKTPIKQDSFGQPERTPEGDAESLKEFTEMMKEYGLTDRFKPADEAQKFQYPVKKPTYKSNKVAQNMLLTPVTNRKGDRLDIIDMSDGSRWLTLPGEDDSFMLHKDGKLDKIQKGSALEVQLNQVRDSMTIPQERLDPAEEEQIMQMVSMVPGVNNGVRSAATYMQLDGTYMEADQDLVAKVNKEVNDMRDQGLGEVDVKHAVFQKYGPAVYESIFKKTGE